MLQLSTSEEVDVLSIEAGEMESPPPHPPAYEELLEVVTHAVAKLNISWPCERQEAHKKSKLDERFFQAGRTDLLKDLHEGEGSYLSASLRRRPVLSATP